MKKNIICGICGFAIGLSLAFWIANKEPESDHLVRLKAKVAAFETRVDKDKYSATSWDWDSYVSAKGEIAVLESKTNIERK